MNVRVVLSAALVGALVLAGGQARSGDKKDFDWQKYMEMYGVPGPEHKHYEPLIGKWDASVKMYMEPGKEPMASKGTGERKWAMGNRYLQESFKGDFGGAQFLGMGMAGFDRFKKKYFMTWVDNMGTGFVYAEGEYDPKAKTFTYTYADDNPFYGKGTKARDVTTVKSNDEHVVEMFRTPPKGGEIKVMEITYTRAAKKAK